MNRRAAVALACVVLLAAARDARASNRYALIVGANAGDPNEQVLRYAESDARRVASVLRTVGHFAPQDITVLTDVTADELRRALIELNARIRQSNQDSMLFVFYTGHAGGTALHLGGTRLPMEEFRDLVAGSAATTRLLVIDACRSGVLTRVKGGKPAASFAVKPPPLPINARGLAILASSAAFEDAQESDALRGSFFTHYFVSALRGAADRDRDNQVTLSEAYTYTSERTLAATAVSIAGPQHPTYRFELGGRNDLVLTQLRSLRRGVGRLEFREPGEYFVTKQSDAGEPVAEVAVKRGTKRSIAVEKGSYHITRRSRTHLLAGSFPVNAGSTTTVEVARMRKLAYARVVRKGGTAETAAVSVYTVGGVRGSLLGIGTGLQAAVGGRIDLSQVSLELRMSGGYASKQNDRITIGTRELGTSAIGVRAFDFRRFTIGAGIEAGAFWLSQQFDDEQSPNRNTFGMLLGPIGVIEVPFGDWWYARAEAAALTYILRTGNDPDMAESRTPLTLRGALGVGAYF